MWIVLRYNCNFIFHARQFESDFRSKKETNYDDKMSEKEWLKAIGAEEEDYEGSSSDVEEEQTPKKRGGGGGRGGRKKGRGGGGRGGDDDDDDDEDDASLASGRKRKRGKGGGGGGGGGSGSMKKLQKKMKKLMEIVIKYQDQDGRVLSEPFMKLPSKKELPDYYEVIRRPVDINKILGKIESEKVSQSKLERCLFNEFELGIFFQYDDLNALEKDFCLLCSNTQKYNEDGSLIYEDSIVLQSVFTNARERLIEAGEAADDDDGERKRKWS